MGACLFLDFAKFSGVWFPVSMEMVECLKAALLSLVYLNAYQFESRPQGHDS